MICLASGGASPTPPKNLTGQQLWISQKSPGSVDVLSCVDSACDVADALRLIEVCVGWSFFVQENLAGVLSYDS